MEDLFEHKFVEILKQLDYIIIGSKITLPGALGKWLNEGG
jgi:hypothetical protein